MRLKDIFYLLTALVCFIIWLMPVTVLLGLLPENKVRLVGMKGGIHQGQVAELIVNHHGRWLNLGSVEWNINPVSLLMFSATGQIRGGDAVMSYSGQFELTPSSLKLEEFSAGFPASVAGRFSQLPANLGGDLAISIQQAEIDRANQWPTTLQGQLTWMNAAAGIGGPAFALGDYGVRLAVNEKQQLTGKVQHLSGPLLVNGELKLDKAGQFSLDALMEQGQGLNPQVWQTLKMVSRPQGDKLNFNYQSKL